VGEFERRSLQRQNRCLNEIVAGCVVVDPTQLLWMDQVLRVVCNNDLEADADLLFVEQHMLIDPVEAVGFRGGSIMRTHGQVDVRKSSGNGSDSFLRRGVVRVASGEDMELAVAD